MDFEEPSFHNVFKYFVCGALAILLGLHMYTYFWNPKDSIEVDFSEIKQVIMQLSYGLTDIKRKHEQLQIEIESISAAIPAVEAAAGRAKDALQPIRHNTHPIDGYDYDRQIIDYALQTAGARVLDTGDTVEYIVYETPMTWILQMVTCALCRGCLSADVIIQPGNLPGECWAFRGSKGEATIRLLGTVHVTGVSIEHISVHISPTKEISSAPRLFQLEGLEFRGDLYPFDFGTFEYNKDGKPIQYFEVQHPSTKGFSLIRLKIHSNWGHPVYTCVYRLRVHGELVVGQSSQPSRSEEEINQ